MSGRLEGKVALVTGAGRGLGVAIAEGLAREGASVAVHYRSSAAGAEETAELVRSLGGGAMTVQGDVAVWDDVAARRARRSSVTSAGSTCSSTTSATWPRRRCRGAS